MKLDEKVEQEVAAVGDLSREELAVSWKAIYKVNPPKGARRPLLERAIAWDLQARALGGLGPKARRLLEEAIRQERRLASRIGRTSEGGAEDAAPRRILSNGARLVREWGGVTHAVDVTDVGYVWQGEVYRSLSVIARTITGTRWSGPRFFGL